MLLGRHYVHLPCHLLRYEAQPITLVCNYEELVAKTSDAIRRCMGDAHGSLACSSPMLPFWGHEAQPIILVCNAMALAAKASGKRRCTRYAHGLPVCSSPMPLHRP